MNKTIIITEEQLDRLFSPNIPTTLYHATPSCYVKSIMEHGLGAIIPENRFWDYDGTPYANITKGCFLANDEYVAESYVETSEQFEQLADEYELENGEELTITVFKVNTTDLDMTLLKPDNNQIQDAKDNPTTYFYDGVIPPDKLEIMQL